MYTHIMVHVTNYLIFLPNSTVGDHEIGEWSRNIYIMQNTFLRRRNHLNEGYGFVPLVIYEHRTYHKGTHVPYYSEH